MFVISVKTRGGSLSDALCEHTSEEKFSEMGFSFKFANILVEAVQCFVTDSYQSISLLSEPFCVRYLDLILMMEIQHNYKSLCKVRILWCEHKIHAFFK